MGIGDNHHNCFHQASFPYLSLSKLLHYIPVLSLGLLVVEILKQVSLSRAHTSLSLHCFIQLVFSSFAGYEDLPTLSAASFSPAEPRAL